MVAGSAVVSGIQLGNVWIGVQPALGVEGDPMRLLFDRQCSSSCPHVLLSSIALSPGASSFAVSCTSCLTGMTVSRATCCARFP